MDNEHRTLPSPKFDRWWPAGVKKVDWSGCESKSLGDAISAIQRDDSPVVLWGSCGRGKSCLAALIASVSRRPRFAAASAILGAMMASQQNGMVEWFGVDRTIGGMIRWCSDASILVIDDLGSRQLTPPQADAMLQILQSRYERGNLIITTNCRPDSIAEMVGQRITSRLSAGVWIQMTGPDRRPERG